jgi:protein SCO1
MNSTLLKVALAAGAALILAVLLLPRGAPPVPAPDVATELYTQARALPAVELIDQHGASFRTAELEGRFSLMFFGFTHCPDVCPLTLQILADARAQLAADEPGEMPDIIFVSVDPKRDTPQRISEYLSHFEAPMRGVTGEDEALAPLLAALGVHVHRAEHEGEHYNVIHNPTVYVIGPRADLIAVFGSAGSAATITTDYPRVRERYLRHAAGELRLARAAQ